MDWPGGENYERNSLVDRWIVDLLVIMEAPGGIIIERRLGLRWVKLVRIWSEKEMRDEFNALLCTHIHEPPRGIWTSDGKNYDG